MFISRLEHLVLLTFVLGVVAEASYSSCYYHGSSFGASSVVDTCLGLALRLRPLLVITLDRAAEAVSVVKCTLFEMACVGWGCFSWIRFFVRPSQWYGVEGSRALVQFFAVPRGAVMFTSVFSPCPPILFWGLVISFPSLSSMWL